MTGLVGDPLLVGGPGPLGPLKSGPATSTLAQIPYIMGLRASVYDAADANTLITEVEQYNDKVEL